jgi:hypothetical protein
MKRDGWERYSIQANTRPIRLPARTTSGDFLLPSGPGTVGMFLQCGIAAFALALFFVLLPLVLVVAYTPLESLGSWWPWPTGAAWIAAWTGLVVGAARENKSNQEWLDEQ